MGEKCVREVVFEKEIKKVREDSFNYVFLGVVLRIRDSSFSVNILEVIFNKIKYRDKF